MEIGMSVTPVIEWPGSGSSPVGKCPMGYFDDDDSFIEEAPKVAKWVAFSLGYPVSSVELTDTIIYSHMEYAVQEFSATVNEFNMRSSMLNIQGISTSSNLTGKLIRGNSLPMIVELSKAYGTEAGVGGNVPFKKGNITMLSGVQEYDLQTLWGGVSESAERLEIRRVWHDRTPAMARFFDPFAGGIGQGLGIENLLGQFGWGNYSVASQYLLMPIYESMLRAQAIEFNDQTRRSQYSFEIHNNNIRLFPVPGDLENGMKLWFEYTLVKDKFASIVGAPGTAVSGSSTDNGGVVSDISNAPFEIMPYCYINDFGKRWIKKYTLAACKITLGSSIRSKYETIPIPNATVGLNGLQLAEEGRREIEELVKNLRETLIKTGRQSQMDQAAEVEENTNQILQYVPNMFFIG